MTKRINKSLVINGITIVSEADWNEELNAKHEKLVAWLLENKLSGVLIRRNENVSVADRRSGGASSSHSLRNGSRIVACYRGREELLLNH